MAIVIHDWAEFITAAGTSGAEVEFPKNLVKTSDTTVDPDKIYVDVNGAVQTNVQPTDLANLYENTFVLDANDYAPERLSSPISIVCASINGFGGTIKNLASSSSNIIETYSFVSFTGIAFLNVRCTNSYFFVSYRNSGWGTIKNCVFSGRIEGTNTCRFLWTSLHHFEKCAFNVQLYGAGIFAQNNESRDDWLDFNTCRINTDDRRPATTYAERYNVRNCYWTGTHSAYITVGMSNCDYTIFDLECADISGNNTTVAAYLFVNSEKCPSTNGIAVTTAQLKDPACMQSKGLPVEMPAGTR